ncbi:MAG: hypothetical protein MAG451_00063 [Anaerolineales bacterium]|nr:hypothetical protein [Anaerolineales bacterium]
MDLSECRVRDFQGNKPPKNGLFPSEILGFWEVLNSGIPQVANQRQPAEQIKIPRSTLQY